MRRLRPRVSSPQPGTSHVPPCVEILALLVRKGKNWRGGGAGTGEGAWKAEVSAVGFRSTLLLSTFHSTPLNIHTTLSRTPLSIPSPPQRRQVDISAGENLSRPPPLAFGPLLGTRVGKKGRHLGSGKPCPSLLPQSLRLRLSSCLFLLAQTGTLPF